MADYIQSYDDAFIVDECLEDGAAFKVGPENINAMKTWYNAHGDAARVRGGSIDAPLLSFNDDIVQNRLTALYLYTYGQVAYLQLKRDQSINA